MPMNWIKMRVDLDRDPKTIEMAAELTGNKHFCFFLQQMGLEDSIDDDGCQHLVSIASAFVIKGLLTVWGQVLNRGQRIGETNNVGLKIGSILMLDEMSGIPGFGPAMQSVDWVRSCDVSSPYSLVFPNLLEDNTLSAEFQDERRRQQNRDAARRHRQQKRQQNVSTVSANGQQKVSTREDKIREEHINISTAAQSHPNRADSGTPARVIAYWNEVFGSKLRITTKRRNALKARWSDTHFREHWAEAIRRVAQSPFCMGQNDKSWLAHLDWFLRPDTVTKIMEGLYDARARTASNSKSADREQRLVAALNDFVNEDLENRVRRTDSDSLHIETAHRSDKDSDAGLVETTVAVRHSDSARGDITSDLPF